MSTIKVVSMTGAEVGSVELNDAIFGIEPNMSVVHEVVTPPPAPRRPGPPRAPPRAVAPEGHRPCPSGQHPRAPVDARRYRVRPQAPQLQLCAE